MPTCSPGSTPSSPYKPPWPRAHSSGEGAFIDMSLFDTQLAVLANQSMNFLVSGRTPHRMGNAHPNLVPYQTFAVADGQVVIAVGSDAQFRVAVRGARASVQLGTWRRRRHTNAARVDESPGRSSRKVAGWRCQPWRRERAAGCTARGRCARRTHQHRGRGLRRMRRPPRGRWSIAWRPATARAVPAVRSPITMTGLASRAGCAAPHPDWASINSTNPGHGNRPDPCAVLAAHGPIARE